MEVKTNQDVSCDQHRYAMTLLAKTIQPATPNVRLFVIVIVGYHFGRQIIPTLLVIVPGTDIRELRSIVKIEAYGRFSRY
jgi:hypothetical protein